MGFHISKAFVFFMIFISTVVAKAGLFSEIDILVREAATAEVSHLYSEDELDHAFYDLTYEVLKDTVPGCHIVLEGEMLFPYSLYKFKACVVANSKIDIKVSIFDLQENVFSETNE